MDSNVKFRKQGKMLKVDITITPKSILLKKIEESLKKNVQIFLSTPNPEILVSATKSDKYRHVLNSSDISIPDGVGITLALKFLYGKSVLRIKGRELFLNLLDIANKNSNSIYLLGSSKDVNLAAINKIKKNYPNIKVRGSSDIEVYVNKYFDIHEKTKAHKDILRDIKVSKTDMLFVFLGAPKQELFVNKYRKQIDAKLIATLGGSLDFYVGKQKLPPKFISDIGLEWMWRLIHQPKRLFRIINATLVFTILVLKEKLLDNRA